MESPRFASEPSGDTYTTGTGRDSDADPVQTVPPEFSTQVSAPPTVLISPTEVVGRAASVVGGETSVVETGAAGFVEEEAGVVEAGATGFGVELGDVPVGVHAVTSTTAARNNFAPGLIRTRSPHTMRPTSPTPRLPHSCRGRSVVRFQSGRKFDGGRGRNRHSASR